MSNLKKIKTNFQSLIKGINDVFETIKKEYKNSMDPEISTIRVYLYTRWECLNKALWYINNAMEEQKNFGDNSYVSQMVRAADHEYLQYLEETNNTRAQALLEKYLSDIDTSNLTML